MATETTQVQPEHEQKRRRSIRQYYNTFSASPLILLTLGGAALVAALFAFGLEINTSEILVYKGNGASIWYVLQQPYLLFFGTEPMVEKLSWLYGWGVEIVDLIFAFALNHVTHALTKVNSKCQVLWAC
ncbi:MAG: hypothetical protein JO202_19415 [Ktedonobacteraceae bacterium]|nr:hypothetical protein [Ktedonobacteraceae bacterium]